ncbi:hypothetical protein BDV32DRAFT_24091 [Aspergillus pseudonomiae]|nr:hypothetical protein BDV32DRAFT_24091 [Aspergillus pseudonomiae]
MHLPKSFSCRRHRERSCRSLLDNSIFHACHCCLLLLLSGPCCAVHPFSPFGNMACFDLFLCGLTTLPTGYGVPVYQDLSMRAPFRFSCIPTTCIR